MPTRAHLQPVDRDDLAAATLVQQPAPAEHPDPETVASIADRVLRRAWWMARRHQGRKIPVQVGVVLFGETMWDRDGRDR